MIKPRLGILAGVAVLALMGIAIAHPGHAPITPPAVTFAPQAQTVAFDLFRGSRIVVPARVNGHQTMAILDTGASVTTFDRGFARSIGLERGISISGRGTGGVVDAELVSGVTAELGGMRLGNMSVGVMDLSSVSRSLGFPVTVVLGRDFFNSAVVSIDWARSSLQIHSPEGFSAPRDAVQLKLSRKGPFNTIPVSVGGGEPVEALFDLGSDGALSLPSSYWNNRPEFAKLSSAEIRSGGVGGLRPARAVTLPEVTLAGRTFAAVPAMLSEGPNENDPTQMANVGIQLMKQFRVDLDLGRDRVYLTSRADGPPFDRDRAGARFEFLGDRLKVLFVSPSSPAAHAGLKAGDEVVAIDGARIDARFYDSPDWTRAAVGRMVTLARADGTLVKVTLADYF